MRRFSCDKELRSSFSIIRMALFVLSVSCVRPLLLRLSTLGVPAPGGNQYNLDRQSRVSQLRFSIQLRPSLLSVNKSSREKSHGW